MNRKILGSTLAIMAVLALTAGTFAEFESRQAADVRVETGDLSLELDNPVTVPISVSRVAPGWSTSRAIALRNAGSLNGTLSVEVAIDDDVEVGSCRQPERTAEGSTSCDDGQDGELAQNLEAALSEGATTVFGADTIEALEVASPADLGAMNAGAARTFDLDLELPTDTLNEAQSDRIDFTVTFVLTQAPTDTGGTRFAGTVSEIVDPAALTGIPRRWMRHVGDPAPAGYSHGYQWGTPDITTPAGAGVITFEGTLDVADALAGEFGLIGMLDTASLATGEGDRGNKQGSYIYVSMSDADTLVLGLSDGEASAGEYVQAFHTIDLTGTSRVFDVTFTIDATADPSTCAGAAADIASAEGCMTLHVGGYADLSDSYGTITSEDVDTNGGVEFRDGATAGWDGLASATQASGIDYDLDLTFS